MEKDVKFIRVNGRVVPIRGKGAGAGQKPKKSKGHLNKVVGKDGSGKSYTRKDVRAAGKYNEAVISNKRKQMKKTGFANTGATIGLGAGVGIGSLFGNKGIAIGGAAGAAAGWLAGSIKAHRSVNKKQAAKAGQKAEKAYLKKTSKSSV